MSGPDRARTAALIAELNAQRAATARAVHELRERLRPSRIAGDAAERLRNAATGHVRRLERRVLGALRSATAGLDRQLPARGGDVLAIAGAALSAWATIQAWRRGRAAILRRPPLPGGSRPLAWGALAAACGVLVGWSAAERQRPLRPRPGDGAGRAAALTPSNATPRAVTASLPHD